MATVTLTQENFEQTVSAGGIVLVDFWATWCGPCRQFGPIFEEASEKYPDIVFGKIDTDDQQQLAMAAQITSIPTLMVFRDGIVVFRQSGALPLSALEDLISQVQNLDMDIQSRIDEINELEAGLLSSPNWSEVKVKGGQPRKIDDVYAQLITMKDAIEQDTNAIIDRKLELGRMINKLSNPKHRTILRMTYINKGTADSICYDLKMSRTTYYRLKNEAISALEEVI